MKIFFMLLGLTFFIGTGAFANALLIHCDKGTGYAETRTPQGGTTQAFYPSEGPFTARIRSDESFIWGYATGGGDLGNYIALGALVTLVNENQISLKQETTEFVNEGTYRFTTSKGHSIACTLELQSFDERSGGYCWNNKDCEPDEWCYLNTCRKYGPSPPLKTQFSHMKLSKSECAFYPELCISIEGPQRCQGIDRYCGSTKNCCPGLECIPSGSVWIGANKCLVPNP